MPIREIIELAFMALAIISAIVTIIISIRNGEMKDFIIAKMEEAEKLYDNLPKPEKSYKKLDYVINAVKEKYKLISLFCDIKTFIEKVVKATKKKDK